MRAKRKTSLRKNAQSANATAQIAQEAVKVAAEQPRQLFSDFGTATQQAADVMTKCCSTAVKRLQDYNSKILEFSAANTKANVEFMQTLAGVKSPSDFFQLSTEHARRQLESMTDQSKQLAAIMQDLAATATEPLKTVATRA